MRVRRPQAATPSRGRAPVSERLAPAKLNLALVVGPLGTDGKHELTTVFQRVDLADRIGLESALGLRVEGFPDDRLVAAALELVAREAGVAPGWAVRIEKQIPVAAGLGGGSSDAAAALLLANETLGPPAPGAAATRAGRVARSRRAVLPHRGSAARRGGRDEADPARPSARLHRRARARGRDRQAVDGVGLRRVRPPERSRRLRRPAGAASSRHSAPATSPPCLRTTSRPRRSRTSSVRSGRSGRT